jgi:hypothetical protein
VDAYTRLLPEALAWLGIDASEVQPKWHPRVGDCLPATLGFYVNRQREDEEGIPIVIHLYGIGAHFSLPGPTYVLADARQFGAHTPAKQ